MNQCDIELKISFGPVLSKSALSLEYYFPTNVIKKVEEAGEEKSKR